MRTQVMLDEPAKEPMSQHERTWATKRTMELMGEQAMQYVHGHIPNMLPIAQFSKEGIYGISTAVRFALFDRTVTTIFDLLEVPIARIQFCFTEDLKKLGEPEAYNVIRHSPHNEAFHESLTTYLSILGPNLQSIYLFVLELGGGEAKLRKRMYRNTISTANANRSDYFQYLKSLPPSQTEHKYPGLVSQQYPGLIEMVGVNDYTEV